MNLQEQTIRIRLLAEPLQGEASVWHLRLYQADFRLARYESGNPLQSPIIRPAQKAIINPIAQGIPEADVAVEPSLARNGAASSSRWRSMEAMRSPRHGGLFPLAAPARRTLPRICVRDPFGDHSANFLRSGPLEAAKDALRASPENAKHMQLIETRRPGSSPTLSSRSRTQKAGKREFREVPSANYWSEPASSPLDHHGRRAPPLGRA